MNKFIGGVKDDPAEFQWVESYLNKLHESSRAREREIKMKTIGYRYVRSECGGVERSRAKLFGLYIESRNNDWMPFDHVWNIN